MNSQDTVSASNVPRPREASPRQEAADSREVDSGELEKTKATLKSQGLDDICKAIHNDAHDLANRDDMLVDETLSLELTPRISTFNDRYQTTESENQEQYNLSHAPQTQTTFYDSMRCTGRAASSMAHGGRVSFSYGVVGFSFVSSLVVALLIFGGITPGLLRHTEPRSFPAMGIESGPDSPVDPNDISLGEDDDQDNDSGQCREDARSEDSLTFPNSAGRLHQNSEIEFMEPLNATENEQEPRELDGQDNDSGQCRDDAWSENSSTFPPNSAGSLPQNSEIEFVEPLNATENEQEPDDAQEPVWGTTGECYFNTESETLSTTEDHVGSDEVEYGLLGSAVESFPNSLSESQQLRNVTNTQPETVNVDQQLGFDWIPFWEIVFEGNHGFLNPNTSDEAMEESALVVETGGSPGVTNTHSVVTSSTEVRNWVVIFNTSGNEEIMAELVVGMVLVGAIIMYWQSRKRISSVLDAHPELQRCPSVESMSAPSSPISEGLGSPNSLDWRCPSQNVSLFETIIQFHATFQPSGKGRMTPKLRKRRSASNNLIHSNSTDRYPESYCKLTMQELGLLATVLDPTMTGPGNLSLCSKAESVAIVYTTYAKVLESFTKTQLIQLINVISRKRGGMELVHLQSSKKRELVAAVLQVGF